MPSSAGRFRVLKGIEVDILADGSLDFPDEVLRTFDLVVASVHSRFNLTAEEQTRAHDPRRLEPVRRHHRPPDRPARC